MKWDSCMGLSISPTHYCMLKMPFSYSKNRCCILSFSCHLAFRCQTGSWAKRNWCRERLWQNSWRVCRVERRPRAWIWLCDPNASSQIPFKWCKNACHPWRGKIYNFAILSSQVYKTDYIHPITTRVELRRRSGAPVSYAYTVKSKTIRYSFLSDSVFSLAHGWSDAQSIKINSPGYEPPGFWWRLDYPRAPQESNKRTIN